MEVIGTMGSREVAQGALFYEFSLEDHGPQDYLIRAIDRFVDLGDSTLHRSTEARSALPSIRN